jgi:hypothetical protein
MDIVLLGWKGASRTEEELHAFIESLAAHTKVWFPDDAAYVEMMEQEERDR